MRLYRAASFAGASATARTSREMASLSRFCCTRIFPNPTNGSAKICVECDRALEGRGGLRRVSLRLEDLSRLILRHGVVRIQHQLSLEFLQCEAESFRIVRRHQQRAAQPVMQCDGLRILGDGLAVFRGGFGEATLCF